MKTHACSREHIDNVIALKTFGRTRIDEALDHGREVSRSNYNLLVTKNRKGLRTLIEVTYFLGCHGLGFRGHDEREESVNRGNYKDLCTFLTSRDSSFLEFTSSRTFSGTSSGIQNQLIECIGDLMVRQIAHEIN